jgi:hypothetical protein
MSYTPETDALWKKLCDSWAYWKSDWAHEELLNQARNMEVARNKLILNGKNLVDFLKSNIKANKRAAINSPQSAEWSNGVAAGLKVALKYLQNH